MTHRVVSFLLPICFLVLSTGASAGLHSELSRLLNTDTTCAVWIVFTDKPGDVDGGVTPRALRRRGKAGYPRTTEQDQPVNRKYLAAVSAHGATLRSVFKWGNAAGFDVEAGKLATIAGLPFVREVFPIHSFRLPPVPDNLRKSRKTASVAETPYGEALQQLEIVGVPEAHRYLHSKTKSAPGSGVLVGVFDNGFRPEHPAVRRMFHENRVIADSDFVAGTSQPYFFGDEGRGGHGLRTSAIIGGYDPGEYLGIAWGAQFILARTEDDEPERHIEEDYWAAAAVWAESLGVDLISSSLGYRDEFTHGEQDYTFEDMDGRTAIVSLAAQWVIDRGVVVVNSMGNEQYRLGEGSLVAPADVENVVSVGAINYDLRLTWFSSLGPTGDGRLKPDLVAVGQDVAVPEASRNATYGVANGTSFSAPTVSGVTALIMQAHPHLSSEGIRNMLYSSCVLTPFQDTVDFAYGRGVPDALVACIEDDEAVVQVRTSANIPVAGTDILYRGAPLGTTDSVGIAVLGIEELPLPATVQAAKNGVLLEDNVTIDRPKTRVRVEVEFDTLVVAVRDTLGKAVRTGSVLIKSLREAGYNSFPIDTGGFGNALMTGTGIYSFYVTAPGYFPAEPDTLSFTGRDTVFVQLEKRMFKRLAVYPNVISTRAFQTDPSLRVHIDFVAEEDQPRAFSQSLRVAVRTINGDLIWEYHTYLREHEPARNPDGTPLTWDARLRDGTIVRPGMYIMTIQYAGKTRLKKILVTG